MNEVVVLQGHVVPFPQQGKASVKPRKAGLNRNRRGSVRSINGQLYVDFVYLGERVREKSGLSDNRENGKQVRQMLDKIMLAIDSGTFRYADVFPYSRKKDYFRAKENEVLGLKKTSDQVLFKNYVWTWFDILRGKGRVSQRTLHGYKMYINQYLVPFFGDKTFNEFDSVLFDRFVGWAKKRCLREKPVSNKTINKIMVPFKMICESAKIEYRWTNYDPFFGFKRQEEGGANEDAYEKIVPFSIEEQKALIGALPDYWKPYFQFAFYSGLRQGEQMGLKPDDIDWGRGFLHVRRGMTKDEDGKRMEGPTKNKYSRRRIQLSTAALQILMAQRVIHEKTGGEYFFCTPQGKPILPASLRAQVWIPALRKAKLQYREMKQTRHTFATIALSCGESPLWIAKVMGHRDTDMIIRVYMKYVKNAQGSDDGACMNELYQGMMGNERE